MKLGCIFLFSAFLFITFQACNAVYCPVISLVEIKQGQCSSCVIYACKKDVGFFAGKGCPEDFFRDCAGIDDVELIKRKNYNDLQYRIMNKVVYVSGCGKEQDGTECILKKDDEFAKIINGTVEDYCIEDGSPCGDSKNGAQKINGILGIGLMIFAWIY